MSDANRPRSRVGLAVGAAVLGMTMVSPIAVSAAQTQPTTAISYINPDTGAATENTNVAATSGCANPVKIDASQSAGDPATTNLHNDACLQDAAGANIDVPAAFDVSGVAEVHACPDPDAEGPKTATIQGKTCLLGGYEADNTEYHVRIKSSTAGSAMVTFCADPEQNGCADATVSDSISVTYVAAADGTATPTAITPLGGVSTGVAPEGRTVRLPLIIGAGVIAAAAALLFTRRRAA